MKAMGMVLGAGVVGVAAVVALSMNGGGRGTEEVRPTAAVVKETPQPPVQLAVPEVAPEEALPPEPEPGDPRNQMPPLSELSFDNPIRVKHDDGSFTIYKMARITHKDGRVEEKPLTMRARLAPKPMTAVRRGDPTYSDAVKTAREKQKARLGGGPSGAIEPAEGSGGIDSDH